MQQFWGLGEREPVFVLGVEQDAGMSGQ